VTEVVFIDVVHLGGDLQRHASSARYSNRAVRVLFGRNPPQEGNVAPRLERRPMQVSGMPWWIVLTKLACGSGLR